MLEKGHVLGGKCVYILLGGLESFFSMKHFNRVGSRGASKKKTNQRGQEGPVKANQPKRISMRVQTANGAQKKKNIVLACSEALVYICFAEIVSLEVLASAYPSI